MTVKKYISLYSLLILSFCAVAQKDVEALKRKLNKAPEVEQAGIYLKIGEAIMISDAKSSEENINKALVLARKLNLKAEEALAQHDLGKVAVVESKIPIAEKHFEEAVKIRREIADHEGLAKSLNQIGLIEQGWGKLEEALKYYEESYKEAAIAKYVRGMALALNLEGEANYLKGDYKMAIEKYQLALSQFETNKDASGIVSTYNNIGGIYNTLEKRKDAIDFYRKAITLSEKRHDYQNLGKSYNNIGIIFQSIDTVGIINELYNLDSARVYNKKANEYFQKANYADGICSSYHNLGMVSFYKKEYSDALENFQKSITIAKSIDNKFELTQNYMGIGLCYGKINKYDSAVNNINTAYNIAKRANLRESEYLVFEHLATVNADFKKFEPAYHSLKKSVELHDELRDNQMTKLVQEMETKYQTAKKEQQIKEGNIKNAAQQKQLFYLLIFFIIVFVVAFYAVLQYLQKRKANAKLTSQNIEISQKNVEIEAQRNQVMKQRDLIEEQQKGIMDSIHYARRIQQAILPSEETLSELFNSNVFILYKPRDIVSGDFYWIGSRGNKKIVVAADCTGHGVPGAFMSMLGTAFLNEIINVLGENIGASQILNNLREYVITSLKQTGKKGEQKDGMDLSMYIFDPETKTVEYAGANNPLFIVRKRPEVAEAYTNGRIAQEIFETDDGLGCALIHIKADKMPIGIYAENRPFESINFQLQEGDVIYNFSDGYVDQFGGPNNMKFLTKRFKRLLTNINLLPMNEQLIEVDSAIEEWKAGYEQIDDILVIGFKV